MKPSYSEAIEQLAGLISDCDSLVLLTHRRPDGDTIGSSCALAAAAKKLGKAARVLFSDEVPEKFKFLTDALGDEQPSGKTLVLAVDVASAEMVKVDPSEYGGKIDACIDHHKTDDGWAPLSCVMPYSACGECVLDLIDRMGVELDIYIARALYTAVSTDTGCFKYGNTNAHSHLTAARLMTVCPAMDDLNYAYFTARSVQEKELEHMVYVKQKLFCGGRGAISSITLADMESIGADPQDLECVTDAVRTTKGVLVGAFLKETKEHSFRASLRGNSNSLDVSVICGKFGGGGHRGAGGCTLEGPEQAARDIMEKAIEEYLKCAEQ